MPTLSDVFGAGETGRLLLTDYSERKVGVLKSRDLERTLKLIGDDGHYRRNGYNVKVPYGVRHALQQPLVHTQIVNKYPWAVIWKGKDGCPRRKLCMTIISAIEFMALARRKGVRASIVSRQRGYDIPPKLRNKIPKPYKWCPFCMDARKYRRVGDDHKFSALRKEWSEEKQRYVWKERKIYLMRCEVCGLSNREITFRRSNQPWEVRKFKRRARRAKPHVRTDKVRRSRNRARNY